MDGSLLGKISSPPRPPELESVLNRTLGDLCAHLEHEGSSLTQRNCKMLALNSGSQRWLHIRSTWGVFKILLLKCPLKTSEVRILPVDANAAARVESHRTELTGVPLWNSEDSHAILCNCLRRKGINNCHLQECRGSRGALTGYSHSVEAPLGL